MSSVDRTRDHSTVDNPSREQFKISAMAPTATTPQTELPKLTPKDFIFGKTIGEGSFSTVYLAKEIRSSKEFAVKVCEKSHIIRERKQKAIMREKQVLRHLTQRPSPFIIQLYATFQDDDRLYFVLTYAKNGELLPLIHKVGSFDMLCTRFYSAELICALEHLYRMGVVHRDLKPENILLDDKMHILVTDFGSAKLMEPSSENTALQERLRGSDGTTVPLSPVNGQHSASAADESRGVQRRHSFVGTAQYVSPEVLTNRPCSIAADLWALGCIIFQMVAGLPPFIAATEFLTFQKITKLEYEFPAGFNDTAMDLVKELLVINPDGRLGAEARGGFDALRRHRLYEGVDWTTLHEQTPPRILPYLPGTDGNEELRSDYQVPDHYEPGLDEKQMTRLLGLALCESDASAEKSVEKSSQQPQQQAQSQRRRKQSSIVIPLTPEEQERRLELQRREHPYHKFVEDNLILREGLVDKRKGLFARRRMLLLTTGPHLYYVDPDKMVLKGQIPWSKELRPEPKNFKTFFIHTPNRTYYLEDPEGFALPWCKAIEDLRRATYPDAKPNPETKLRSS